MVGLQEAVKPKPIWKLLDDLSISEMENLPGRAFQQSSKMKHNRNPAVVNLAKVDPKLNFRLDRNEIHVLTTTQPSQLPAI